MNSEIEKLIDLAIADGQISEKERSVIYKKSSELGVDLEEVEITLEGKLHQLKNHKQKVGIIKTCPSCGSELEAFLNSCKDCGHELRFDALERLINKIELNPNSERDIISNFNIPINKESLIEFFTFSIGKIEDEGLDDSIKKAWFAKLQEAISIINSTGIISIESEEFLNINKRIDTIKWKLSLDSSTIQNTANVNDLLNQIKIIKDEKNNLESSKGINGNVDEDYFDKKIENLIRSYPIPSSKGEILNFLTVCVANGSNKTILGTLEKESLAWNLKAIELIKKSRINFPNDTILMKELILFDKKMKGAKRQNDIFTFVIATIVIIGIIFWVKSCK
jgi:hypothetical protein